VIKVMFRPLSNQFIVMTLGTSMASMFGVEELTGRTYNLSSQTYLSVESFSVAAVIYIAITILATFALAIMGRFLFRARTGVF
jgi:polar amino acid transport system permease protein